MGLSPGFTHSTFSPIILLALAVASSAFVVVANLRSKSVANATAMLSSAFLVLLAGAHVPFVASIAPKTFCFGNIGVLHIVSFALPLATAIILHLRRIVAIV